MKIITIIKSVIVAIALTTTATAGMVSANTPGWTRAHTNGNKVTTLMNVGDQGGALVVSCDVKTNNIYIDYIYEGIPIDFFILTKFGTDGNDEEDGIIVGGGSTTQMEAYRFLLNSPHGLTVSRYAIGSRERLARSVKAGDKVAPELTYVDTEFFITGDVIRGMLNNLAASCPVDSNQNKAIF